jgi:hypothetical protein
MDLFGVLSPRVRVFPDDKSALEHDAKMLRGDWESVLGDIDCAIKKSGVNKIKTPTR